MKRNTRLKLNLLTVVFVLANPFFSNGQDIISIHQNEGEPQFDGIPNEVFWQEAQHFDLVMHKPNYGELPSENSKVLISYDKNYLWVSAVLDYKDPNHIVSTSKKRDEESKNPDAFGILLDTYNDNENALAFFTMPAGQRIDFTVSNDAQEVSSSKGIENINYAWNTFWDVKTAMTENGWSLEMRIPFSSLRFQVVDNKVRMGLIINRRISYCNETDTYPAVEPKYGKNAMRKPSLATTIELSGIQDSKPVYIAPYIITGIDKCYNLNDEETAYLKSEGNPITAGVDVKYSLTSNLTMDLSLNTDFAQVEADDEKVNLTRYSLYYPEKRTFFQERSSIFNFNLNDEGQLFYSRRIGIDDDGGPTSILGGARMTGRMGNWDMGFIDMQTREDGDISAENFGVLRFRRQVINQNSYIGALMTSRISMESDNHYSYGLDGIFRLFGDDYLEMYAAQTTDSLGNDFQASNESSFGRIKWERRNSEGFAYRAEAYYSGKDFDPQVGFMASYGKKGYNVKFKYGWIPGAGSKLFSYDVNFYVKKVDRVMDGGLDLLRCGPGVTFTTKSGWYGKVYLFYVEQGVDEEFSLDDDVDVPIDIYKYSTSYITFKTPKSKLVSSEFSITAGEFYDGNNLSITSEPMINLSSSVQISGYYNFNRVVFQLRHQEMNAHIGRLKFLYMYNTKLSVSSFVQLNTVNSLAVANFRLRYNPKEGNDLYLVYNETRPTHGYFDEGISEVDFLNRTIQIKYVHTFRL